MRPFESSCVERGASKKENDKEVEQKEMIPTTEWRETKRAHHIRSRMIGVIVVIRCLTIALPVLSVFATPFPFPGGLVAHGE